MYKHFYQNSYRPLVILYTSGSQPLGYGDPQNRINYKLSALMEILNLFMSSWPKAAREPKVGHGPLVEKH